MQTLTCLNCAHSVPQFDEQGYIPCSNFDFTLRTPAEGCCLLHSVSTGLRRTETREKTGWGWEGPQ